MKRLISFAAVSVAIVASAYGEKLAQVVLADSASITRQATLLGEQCGFPMIGMMAAQGLQSNPFAEMFGPMRDGACISITVSGDVAKLSESKSASAFAESLGVVALYPCTTTKEKFLAANPGTVETNGVMNLPPVIFPGYMKFSPDNKWVAIATREKDVKNAFQDAGKTTPAAGAAFDIRLTSAGMKFLGDSLRKELSRTKSGMTPAESAQLDRSLDVISQIGRALLAVRMSDKGLDFLFSATPATGSELAKCGEKPFTKADPLAFAGRESLAVGASAPDCGSANSLDCLDKVLAYLKNQGIKTDYVAVDRKGSECRLSIDLQSIIKYVSSGEAEKSFKGLSDPVAFVKGLQAACTPASDGKFRAASPEMAMSLSLKGVTLPSTASQRYAKTVPELNSKKPFSVCVFSLYAFFRSIIDGVVAAKTDDPQVKKMKPMLQALPAVGDGSIVGAFWRDRALLKGMVRISPEELKNLTTFFTLFAIPTLSGEMGMVGGSDDDWEDESDEGDAQ